MRGEAADLRIIGLSNEELFTWIKQNLEFDQLIREYPIMGEPMSGWIHVSYKSGGNRQQVFTRGAKVQRGS